MFPKNPNVINVLGEVLNPLAFEYSRGIRINEAIENAGGYQESLIKEEFMSLNLMDLFKRQSRNIFTGNSGLRAWRYYSNP